MLESVYELFGIVGSDAVGVFTMSQFIPYMTKVSIGVSLVSAVFSVIGGIVRVVLSNMRRL